MTSPTSDLPLSGEDIERLRNVEKWLNHEWNWLLDQAALAITLTSERDEARRAVRTAQDVAQQFLAENETAERALAKARERIADLRKALEDVPLPSTQGGWSEFIQRFYPWLKERRDAALSPLPSQGEQP